MNCKMYFLYIFLLLYSIYMVDQKGSFTIFGKWSLLLRYDQSCQVAFI